MASNHRRPAVTELLHQLQAQADPLAVSADTVDQAVAAAAKALEAQREHRAAFKPTSGVEADAGGR